jgi:hypothetical protein
MAMNVSEKHAACILRDMPEVVVCSSEMLVSIYKTKQCHNPRSESEKSWETLKNYIERKKVTLLLGCQEL